MSTYAARMSDKQSTNAYNKYFVQMQGSVGCKNHAGIGSIIMLVSLLSVIGLTNLEQKQMYKVIAQNKVLTAVVSALR